MDLEGEVANPARGLLNREKRTKEKVWQRGTRIESCDFIVLIGDS